MKTLGLETPLMMPVLLENATEVVTKGTPEEGLSGLMLFGGQTIGVAAKYDQVRSLRGQLTEMKRDDLVLGYHQNVTPCKW